MYNLYDSNGRFIFGMEAPGRRHELTLYDRHGLEYGYGDSESWGLMGTLYQLYTSGGESLGSLEAELGESSRDPDCIVYKNIKGVILARVRASEFGEEHIKTMLLGSRAQQEPEQDGGGTASVVRKSAGGAYSASFAGPLIVLLALWWFILIYARFDDGLDANLRTVVGTYLTPAIGALLLLLAVAKMRRGSVAPKAVVAVLCCALCVSCFFWLRKTLDDGLLPLADMAKSAALFALPLLGWDLFMGVFTQAAARQRNRNLARFCCLTVHLWHNIYVLLFTFSYTLVLYREGWGYTLLGTLAVMAVSLLPVALAALLYRALAGKDYAPFL